MRITLIDASPKFRNSTSGKLMNMVKSILGDAAEVCEMKLSAQSMSEEQKNILQKSDGVVLFCPLYLDCLPGHLLSCLVQMEREKVIRPNTCIYGVVNCGFYEGIQAETALWVLENWCEKVGAKWGGGLGAGGGGAIAQMPLADSGQGPMASIYKELQVITQNVKAGIVGENRYAQLNFPRFLYKMAGEMGWRSAAKESGLSRSDLGRKQIF